MRIVVMSSPKDEPNEVVEVIRMFEAGLEYFHVRKPRKNRRQLMEYIKDYPPRYHSRLILHSYHGLSSTFELGGIHLSRKHRKRGKIYRFKLFLKRRIKRDMVVTRTFHKLTDLSNDRRTYSYAFLSPVFDSITHSTLSGGFSKRALLMMLPQARQPIYAMGGVTPERLEQVAEYGFQGAVLVGAVWEGEDEPHSVFARTLEIARKM
jgi:thiamine-phosphate pyrophosphorylase